MTQLDNPYVGPRTFTRQESSRFFGREREANDLFSLVVSERLVLFYAQSGAGKSSLINTRLIPQLQKAGFAVLPIGRVSGELPAAIKEVGNIFTFNLMLSLDQSHSDPQRFTQLPLTDFLARLVSDDGEHYIYEAAALREPKAPYGQAQDEALREPKAPYGQAQDETEGFVEAPYVLMIDQFEEIITTHSARWPEREDFFRQLDQAMTDDPLLWVVLTFREDYLAAIEPYASLLTNKMRARFYMQRMGYESALEAVKKPAEQGGRPFASGVAESLVDNLRQIRSHNEFITTEVSTQESFSGQRSAVGGRNLGQFVEPVQLQVVCYQLWENLKARPAQEITQSDLQELGNVDRTLADFYEQALLKSQDETGTTELELRDWFEHELITKAGTRGSVYRGQELTEGIPTRTADFLVNQFLLRTESRAGGIWYELVHDRFVEPIVQANKVWRAKQPPLLQLAEAWENSGENPAKLLEGQQLQEALAAAGAGLDRFRFVKKFLEASQATHQKKEAAWQAKELTQARVLLEAQSKAARRLRWMVVALSLSILTAIVVIGLLIYTGLLRTEIVLKDALITTSLALDGQLYIAVAPDGKTINLTDTAGQKLLLSLTGHTAEVTRLNLSPDRAYLATSDQSGVTLIWDLRRGQLIKKLTGHEKAIRYVVFSHDSQWLATGGDDGTTRVWDTSTWEQRLVLKSDSGSSIVSVAFWPDDSRLVTVTNSAVYTIWMLRTGEKWVSCKVAQSGLNCQ
ncbi:MAG: hypothetical protein HYR94_06890 [Chloroflexi bacterium]|nr:hypothetical protein [Chloroflexota bacterium]